MKTFKQLLEEDDKMFVEVAKLLKERKNKK